MFIIMVRCNAKWLERRLKLYNDISGDNLTLGGEAGRYQIKNHNGSEDISPLDTCTCADSVLTTMIKLAERKKYPRDV